MLKSIKLVNFKSFSNANICLAPMTLLAGLNNSGKSSVIQAARMMQKWYETGDPTLPNYGSISELKNKNASQENPIIVELEFTNQKINMGMKIDFTHGKGPVVARNPNQSYPFPFLNYVSADRWGPRVRLPTHTAMGDLTHTGDQGEFVLDLLERNDTAIVPEALNHPDSEGDTLLYNARAWLREISPNIEFKHAINRQSDSSYAVIDTFRSTNSGFGISYTLPIIVGLLFMAAEWRDETLNRKKQECGTLVLVENPEAHLHPKGQTAIGRLIALTASAGVQVIVETHSDHIMDGLRIAVKEGSIPKEQTVFHYFSRGSNYESTISTPKINNDGKLDFWPEGFFDQTLKNRALLARRNK